MCVCVCICPPIRVVYRCRNILPIDTLTEETERNVLSLPFCLYILDRRAKRWMDLPMVGRSNMQPCFLSSLHVAYHRSSSHTVTIISRSNRGWVSGFRHQIYLLIALLMSLEKGKDLFLQLIIEIFFIYRNEIFYLYNKIGSKEHYSVRWEKKCM